MANQTWIRLRSSRDIALALAGAITVSLLDAQAPVPARPSFEVASVKVSKTEGAETQNWGPQEIYLGRAGLLTIIAEAYQTPYTRISAPKDSASQRVLRTQYDIAAKSAHPAAKSELLLMLQSLFEDRFKLAIHHESKTEDVYKLVVAKGSPKLELSKTDGPASGTSIPGSYSFKNIEMWRFCAILSGRMARPVVDQTNLNGVYDFTLKLDTQGISSPDPDLQTKTSDWSYSSVFTDIQKQLGLQLVSGKAPVDYLVIDRVESPSEN